MQPVTELGTGHIVIGQFLTVRQTSLALNVGEGAVRQHFDNGNLKGIRGPGGDRLIHADSVRRFKRQRENRMIRRER